MFCGMEATFTETQASHSHEIIELIICLSDSGRLKIDNEEFAFKKGRTFLIPKYVEHQILTAPNQNAQCYFVCFYEKSANLVGPRSLVYHLKSNRHASTTASIIDEDAFSENHRLATRINKEIQKTKLYSEEMINSLISQLLINHCRLIKAPTIVKQDSRHKIIQQCCQDIINNPTQEIHLDDMAARMGMSRSLFAKTFKEFSGQSLIEFTNEIRLKQAATALENTQYSVTQIAFDSGFSNLGNFYTQFKKMYHMPPAEYRRWSQEQKQTASRSEKLSA